MRRTDHKNGTPSEARRPRLVVIKICHANLKEGHCFQKTKDCYEDMIACQTLCLVQGSFHIEDHANNNDFWLHP